MSTRRWALFPLAASCALGTTASEVAVGLSLLVTLWVIAKREPIQVLGGQTTWAYALLWLLMVPITGDLREGLGHIWPIAPLLTIPMLRGGADPPDLGLRLGLWLAAGVGAWAAIQGLSGEATGPFSHHLTLAYALLPPLGVALHRRSWLALPLALGVMGSRSSGAVVALGVTVLLGIWAAATPLRCWRRAPSLALLGMALTVAALPFAARSELHERAILWTGGLQVGTTAPAGPGGYGAASAPYYDRLEAGFWFPNHAHDSAVQILAVLGPAGWLCALLLVTQWFKAFGPGAAAGLAGVCVGSLTQDTFGDLEVIRAVVIWGALTAAYPKSQDLRPTSTTAAA